MTMQIRRREVLRYLGYRGHPADAVTQEKIEECCKLLLEAATPRSVYAAYSLQLESADIVQIGDMQVKSHILWNHLWGCSASILFAATLGARADALMGRYAKLDISMMVILQACAAELIESYCDECEESIRKQEALRGLYLRPRFSPGYGDFDIRHQRDFMDILDCSKRIGLTMTDSFMLAPSKSVTAVIGLTTEKQGCRTEKCASCGKQDCAFRKG